MRQWRNEVEFHSLIPDQNRGLHDCALRDAGTTCRAEVEAFRIRRAQELLRAGDRSVGWIAAELGFSSATVRERYERCWR